MNSSRSQLVAIAALVCLFAVGMAALLNYYKYRSTAASIVKSRLVVVGRNIENTIQAALAVGLAFSELSTLPAVLDRERRADDVIRDILVFDPDGNVLFHVGGDAKPARVANDWLAAARSAASREWFVDSRKDPAVGVSIQNNFGVKVGDLAIRYSTATMAKAAGQVAREIAIGALAVFIGAAGLAALLVAWVMRRVEADVQRMERALSGERAQPEADAERGLVERSLEVFLAKVSAAEAQIVAARIKLRPEAGQ